MTPLAHFEKRYAITEQGQIINTLMTKNYKVNSNYIEVIPLNSKETYILRGSAEIIPAKN